MENKILFLDPLFPRRSFKYGAEGLLGAAVLGGTGLLSGVLGASSAKANNADAIAFNRWSQLQSQQYNTQMYERQLKDQEDMYNKYQSPQAIAMQLRQAGINPSALAGKGGVTGNMPSVPSPGTPGAISAPPLDNSGAYIGQGVEQMSRVISNLTDSQLKQKQTTKVLAEIKGQEIANAQADFSNYLMTKYAENEKVAHLNDLIASAALKDAEKDYAGANTDLAKAMKLIRDKELGIKDEEYAQLVYRGSRLVQLYDDQHALNLEYRKTERSKQGNYRASTGLLNSQKVGQDSQNVVLANEANMSKETYFDKLDALKSRISSDKNLSEKQKGLALLEIRKLNQKIQQDTDTGEFLSAWKAAVDHLEESVPFIGSILRIFK